jgi:hypothetical protein
MLARGPYGSRQAVPGVGAEKKAASTRRVVLGVLD